MLDFYVGLAQYLETNGVGTIQQDLWVGPMPDEPIACSCVLGTGGARIQGQPVHRSTFQILCRNNLYQPGARLNEKVFGLLDEKWDAVCPAYSGKTFFINEPDEFYRDQNRHFVFFLNVVHRTTVGHPVPRAVVTP